MSEVIPMNDPDLRFNFREEARSAAVNEACAGAVVSCTIDAPCNECLALAKIIEGKLLRAFLAGQSSVMRTGD